MGFTTMLMYYVDNLLNSVVCDYMCLKCLFIRLGLRDLLDSPVVSFKVFVQTLSQRPP